MSAEGSSVKVSSQQSSTSFPKVKGGGPLFSGLGPLITGGLVNDTTPESTDVRGGDVIIRRSTLDLNSIHLHLGCDRPEDLLE